MKLFVTGGTGFIGKQVLNKLADSEHKLVCLVRKTNPDKEKLQNAGISVIEGDVRDKASVLHGINGCDCVINLANIYSFWERDPSDYRAVNVDGTRNVMEAALEAKVSKVVHVSTTVTYGKPKDVPFTEESEPGPVRFSRYAQSKLEGDQIAWDLYKNKGLPLVVVYPSGVLGAGDKKPSGEYVGGILNKRLPATVFNSSILTWVHVKDVAEGIVKAAEKPDNIGERYFICKHQISIGELNKLIREVSGVSLPVISMPTFMAMMNAYLFTGLSKMTKKPPPWGMSVDQMKTMKEGFRADGSKAERELGITYTPIRAAIEEFVAAERQHIA